MTSKIPLSIRALSIVLCCASIGIGHAGVASPSVLEDYDGLTKGVAVTALTGDDMFGDKTSLFDGATTFTSADVMLKTNSALTVSIGRKLSNAGLSLNTWRGGETSVFGRYWVLDIPNIHGTFDKRTGWVVRDRDYKGGQFPDTWMGSTQRCSVADFTPPMMPDNDTFDKKSSYGASDYWAGNSISIPGMGEELMLNLSAAHARPSDGLAYFGGTKSHWKVACLPSISNGAGEGFLVVLPNGQRYTFDWMVTRSGKRIEGSPGEFGGGLGINRVEVFLYATRVEDANGNWLSYKYDAANPHRLLSIRSNDGVEAKLTYNASGKIETISSAGRVWTYEYVPFNEGGTSPYSYWLSGVVLPDGGRWGYQYGDRFDFMHTDRSAVWLGGCSPTVGTMTTSSQPEIKDVGVFTINHPSGAIGEFKFRKLLHGTNNTGGHCMPRQEQFWGRLDGSPMAYTVGSLYSKTITGPGVPASSWSYFYKPTWSWAEDCKIPGACVVPSETRVVNPDGSANLYKFNNNYASNVGELIEQSLQDTAGRVVQTTLNAYVPNADGQPFPVVNGELPKIAGSTGYLKNRPLKTRQIIQDGVTFVTENRTFDDLARTLSFTGYNTLGYSRDESAEFYDHRAKWILGQVAATSINGMESGRAEFDPVTALPLRVSAFGKHKNSFTYLADGSLESIKDGNGNATVFGSWKRGVPQSIRRPATPESPSGATESAVVDDRGWVIGTTDENAFTSQYSYDGMGRLAGVVYPQNDTVDWYPMTQEFTRVASPEYGLEANHWRRVSITGNRRSDTYYDAFMRPVLEMEFDVADASRNTQKQVFTRYDGMGRMAFRSNPTRHVADFRQSMTGASYAYDALGRITSTMQDSELGALSTTIEYLAGFKRKTTNPRGLSTVETFQVFGQPSYEAPAVIDVPENVRTQIMRDAFGKPLQIQRVSTAQ